MALMLMVILAACSGAVTGEVWANITSDGRYVYVAYKEQVFRLDTNATPDSSNHLHFTWLTQAPNKPHFYAAPALASGTSGSASDGSSTGGAVYVGAYDGKFYAFNRDQGGALAGWNIPTPSTSPDKIIGGATVVGNTVYVGSATKGLRAFDITNGQQLAAYQGTQNGIWAAPLIVGDTLYVTSLDHMLYALNAQTLTYKWQVDLKGSAADTPVYDNGMLYVGTFTGQVLGIDTTATDPACTAHVPCIARKFDTINNAWVWSSPTLDNGVLYFGDLSGGVYALDAKTFAQKWAATNKDNGAVRGRVAVISNVKPNNRPDASTIMIVGTENKDVYAYDVRDGSLVWQSATATSDKILSNMLIVKNDVVFTTVDENQLVVALNVVTGQIDWQVSLQQEMDRFKPTSQPS